MIPLRLKVDMNPAVPPFVVRLNADWKPDLGTHDATVASVGTSSTEYETHHGPLTVHGMPLEALDGDVVLVIPERYIAHRLIRANSRHNTFLVTERCDQLCVMCSQPPKKHHHDLFAEFEQAALLAPLNCVIGISGGEPTLYKTQLFDLLDRCLSARPDISFHILSNGQHFEETDIPRLGSYSPKQVQWGIPLYSHLPEVHDAVVVKQGAFTRLEASFVHLFRAEASIELRTVITTANEGELVKLATYISTHLPFIAHWSLMQLERIGYARKNWNNIFFDHSQDFSRIGAAVDLVRARGIQALLFNFPLCTIPAGYRQFAPATISDWKQRFLPVCSGCTVREQCSGFFEWYDEAQGYGRVGAL
jgi:His-Xaa-Ser system radical SAM maturase HxsC